MPLEGRHHVLDRHIISNRRKVIHKRLFQKPLWRPSRYDFLRSGAHVLKYAPLRCSKITHIRLTGTTFKLDHFRLTHFASPSSGQALASFQNLTTSPSIIACTTHTITTHPGQPYSCHTPAGTNPPKLPPI